MDRPYDCHTGRLTGECYLAQRGIPHKHCYCMLPMPQDATMCDLCRREQFDTRTGKRGRKLSLRLMTPNSPHIDLLFWIKTGKMPEPMRDRPGRRGRRVKAT